MGFGYPEVERVAGTVPKVSREAYRQTLVEVLEEIAASVDAALGVRSEDLIDERRENIGIAVEASYVAIDESIRAACNYVYMRKLHEKASRLRGKES